MKNFITKVMVIGQYEKTDVQIDEISLEQVTSFKYLYLEVESIGRERTLYFSINNTTTTPNNKKNERLQS